MYFKNNIKSQMMYLLETERTSVLWHKLACPPQRVSQIQWPNQHLVHSHR